MFNITLYGLGESLGIGYGLLEEIMKEVGLWPMSSSACVSKEKDMLVLCYVDDLLIMRNDMNSVIALKKSLAQ